MIKLGIFNMNRFLQTVNNCTGVVNLLYPDGRKENINKRYDLQRMLCQQHREGKKYLRLSLEIPEPGDYLDVIFFSIGDC